MDERSEGMQEEEEEEANLLAESLEFASSLAEAEYELVPVADEVLDVSATNDQEEALESFEDLRESIAVDLLAASNVFTSPFQIPPGAIQLGCHRDGDCNDKYLKVPLIYCDQTASNRALQSIENYIQGTCLPLYGNTHTNTSITGAQSTAFVAEARQIVAEETNARIAGKASLDVVLFAGSGTTAAVELLIDCMGLRHAALEGSKKPVIFVGPHEHHSNIIPWRETGCEIISVPECPITGAVSYDALEKLLQTPSLQNRLKLGTFSAASNINGKIADVDKIAAILHRYGALAFFDYATGAPYMKIDMNPPPSPEYPTASMIAKDAVFLSPHKMIGGIGTPGVLIVKKNLVNQQNAPSRSGGGTVFYVSNTHHRFLSNRIDRYEGGTPNVVGIARIGLSFLFKRKIEKQFRILVARQSAGDNKSERIPESVQSFDCLTYNRVARYLREHAPNLLLLDGSEGDTKSPHLPIFSFLIKCGNRFLHFNYVCAILNDVFGIQSRGGCQCAGPYSQRLLGLSNVTDDGEIPNEQNKAIEHALLHCKERAELLRPGYTRLSLPFKGLRSDEVEYVMRALAWTAKNGWALMCNYRCNHRTGEWRNASRQGKPLGRTERKWLSHFDGSSTGVELGTSTPSDADARRKELQLALANADYILQFAKSDRPSIVQALNMNEADKVPDDLESLRWYMCPHEVAAYVDKGVEFIPGTDSEEILGGLTPRTCSKVERQTLGNQMDVQVPVARSRKRKPTSPDVGFTCATQAQGKDTPLQDDSGKMEGISDIKNERKKPARDFVSWGQGQFVKPKSSAGQFARGSKGGNDPVAEAETRQAKRSKQRHSHVRPPAKMMRHVTQAVVQWNMLEDGDRLLLGLSGGKDSLSLLHCLLECKRKMPINFEIEVCTVDPMTPSFDPSPLIPYVNALGLKYHYIKDDIVARATSAGKDGKAVSSLCAFCARMKRGNLYTCARENNCNKLVLAQHLDDCAESFLMSVMHNGFLRTMKANYKIDAGDLSVIRPLIYCRESLMTNFSKSANLPVINENCPACFEEPKERARTKKLLSREEALYPHFYDNIRRSLIPLMHDDMSGILRGYTEDVVAKSRKEPSTTRGKRRSQGKRNPKEPSGEQTSAKLENAEEVVDVSRPKCLSMATEEELLKELAKRKANRFRENAARDGVDPTGVVCSLKGGNGTIPCRELME